MLTAVCLVIPALWACTERPGPDSTETDDDAVATVSDTGDLEAMRQRGSIRYAWVARANIEELPRLATPAPGALELAQEFADRLDLEPLIQQYESDAAAFSDLLQGRVDAIVGRRGAGVGPPPEGVALSTPFQEEPGVFVARAGQAPGSIQDLAGARLALSPAGSFLGIAEALGAAVPDLVIDTVDAATPGDVVERILDGEEELTLIERWVGEALVAHNPELELGTTYGKVRHSAAVRASNTELLRVANDFLFQVMAAGDLGALDPRDLEGIRERGTLRVLTVNGPSSYFVYKGEVVGFDYELLELFADEQDVLTQMIVVPSVDELVPWLRDGRGDLIGSGVVPPALNDTAGVSFTRAYHDVHPVVLARAELGLTQIERLDGLTVVVARNNPFLPYVQEQREPRGFDLQVTPDAESPSQMLDRLESGEADLTVIESHLVAGEMAYRDSTDIAIVAELDTVPGRSWSVRQDQPELLAALDDFIGRQRGSLTYNVLRRKYFQPDTRIVEPPDLRSDGSLSPFDELVQTHAAAGDFDWRVLTAQMFVESRFDPRARSNAGAYGLLQMMPAAARQVGVTDLDDPEEQIRGGVAYMSWLFDRFPDDLELADRRAFTLAAYNAGFGHVTDARHVAEAMGLDPDKWYDNVEVAMRLLSDPDVYRNTTHGYVRGQEPVRYVRRIAELGQMYVRLKPTG